MKRIIQLFILTGAFLISCEQEKFSSSGLEGLRDFTLTPVPNSKIALNSLQKNESIVITWQVARSGFDSPVTYTWLLDEEDGDFSTPLLSLPSDEDGSKASLTLTNDEWEELLTELGVAEGAELKGSWTVRATNGDVTKTAPGNIITFMRYSEALMTFELAGPASNETVFLKESEADTDIEITWDATLSGLGAPVTYEWLLDEVDGDFSEPALTFVADNDGADTKLSLSHEELENALADLGVDEQSLASFQWTIRAKAGEVEQYADEAFVIKLVRWGTEVRLRIPTLPTLTLTDKDIYAAGSFGFLGLDFGDWQQPGTNSLLKLIEDTDDSYYLDINVPKGYSFEYKFAQATSASPSWDFEEQKFNDEEDGCEGISNRQFTFTGTNHEVDHTVDSWKGLCPFDVVEVTFELKGYPEVPDGYDVYMAGEFGNLGVTTGNWNEPGTNPDLKLTLDDDDVYRKKFAVSKAQATTTIVYKYFLAPTAGSSWGNGEQSFSETGCQGLYNGAEGTDNRKYTYELGDGSAQYVEGRVLTWEGFCDAGPARARFEVTVPEETPEDMDVYIGGDLGFIEWPQPGTAAALKMRAIDEDTYEIYLPVPNGEEIQLKFFLATTETPAWNHGEQKFNSTVDGCEGVDNRTFTFNGSNEYTGTVISWEGYCPF